GGTGVITIGALLGMAAHLEGKGITVLDQTGLAQKNGAVGSHVRICANPDDLHATRISAGGARLLLGCDIVTASTPDVLAMMDQGMSSAVINGHVTPPAAFVIDNTIDLSSRVMAKQITEATGPQRAEFVDATTCATALLGDSIASNLFMVGFAYQKGLIPLQRESIEEAIRLNAVAVDFNLQAFSWGRLAVADRAKVEELTHGVMSGTDEFDEPESLDELVERRIRFLTDYQNSAYAKNYEALVSQARKVEREKTPGHTELGDAIARNLFKLMAYKDEYEVARLYTDPAFMEKVKAQFDGDFSLRFHLAPPLFAKRNEQSGELIKREYGPWMLKVMGLLASFRGLRGGAFDIFGYTAERKMERQLIADYRTTMATVMDELTPENHGIAIDIAQVPDKIRGFGHVKERNVVVARKREGELLATLRTAIVDETIGTPARMAAAGGD
ncbi:MAG: indolepyruvate ferredoxin oxidoreductase, partial [Gammaproteobacteria bacterium]